MSAEDKRITVTNWLKNYARDSGEWMPNEKNIVQLTDYKWLHVYKTCMRQIKERSLIVGNGAAASSLQLDNDLMCYTEWMRIRKDQCPTIRIRKYKALAKCTECDRLDKLLSKTNGDEREVVRLRKARHTEWFMAERAKKRHHEDKVIKNNGYKRAMLIEIDGMDHSKTSLPVPARCNKQTDGLPLLHTHLTGVFQFCSGKKQPSGYLWHDRFPAGADVVISILLDVLARTPLQDFAACETLYLYLDNCSRENKNQYVLGICHLLVQYGIFKYVRLGFLPKGHTHTENNDAMFGCFTNPLKLNDTYTWEDLKRICQASYTPTPQFYELKCIGSYSTKMAPHLSSSIDNITKPRYYKIERDAKGIVRHSYRRQLHVPPAGIRSESVALHDGGADEVFERGPSGDKWMPFNTDGYIMFPNTFPDIFSGILQVPPTPIDTKDIRSITMKQFKEYFTPAQEAWWSTTLASIEMVQDAQCRTCVSYRNLMKENSSHKGDAKQIATDKGRIRSNAYKDMGAHLVQVTNAGLIDLQSSGHNWYPSPVLQQQFQYINGGYVEIRKAHGQELQTAPAKELFERLDFLEQEGVPCHWIGPHSSTRGPTDRDAKRNWAGFDEDKVIIFSRVQEQSDDIPWGVGLCKEIKKDNEGTVKEFMVHLMDNEQSSRLPGSTFKLFYKQGTVEQVANNVPGLKRMYCGLTQQYGQGFKPVLETCCSESACEWGRPRDIFKISKGNVVYIIRKSILKVLHDNPRVSWSHPEPLPPSWKKQDKTNEKELAQRNADLSIMANQLAPSPSTAVLNASFRTLDVDDDIESSRVPSKKTKPVVTKKTKPNPLSHMEVGATGASATTVVRTTSARLAKDKVVNYAELQESDANESEADNTVEYYITEVIGHDVHKKAANKKWVILYIKETNILLYFLIDHYSA